MRPALVVLLLPFLSILSCGGDEVTASNLTADEPGTKLVSLEIEGMSCPISCAPAVKAQLAAQPGVRACEVDYESATARCQVDEDLDPQTLVAAVTGQFKAKLKE